MYRGKRVDNGDWAYGYLTTDYLQESDRLYIVGIGVETRQIDKNTIGQCTGLLAGKSCRGESEDARAVFEGDILEGENADGEIKEAYVFYKYGGFCTRTNGKVHPLFIIATDQLKIIGTIHDAERAGSDE